MANPPYRAGNWTQGGNKHLAWHVGAPAHPALPYSSLNGRGEAKPFYPRFIGQLAI